LEDIFSQLIPDVELQQNSSCLRKGNRKVSSYGQNPFIAFQHPVIYLVSLVHNFGVLLSVLLLTPHTAMAITTVPYALLDNSQFIFVLEWDKPVLIINAFVSFAGV